MSSNDKAISPIRWLFGVCLILIGIVVALHGALASENWTTKIVLRHVPMLDIGVGGILFLLGLTMSRGFARERRQFYRKFFEFYNARAAAQRIGDEAAFVNACDRLSALELEQGDLESAEAHCKEILAAQHAHLPENRPRSVGIYLRLARINADASKGDEVDHWIAKVHEASDALPELEQLQIEVEIGLLYSILRRLDDAEHILSDCLKIARGLGAKREIAAIFHGLGMISRDRGEFETAEGFFMKALNDEDSSHHNTYSELGICSSMQGKYVVAGEWFMKSYRAAQQREAVYGMDRARQNFKLNYVKAPLTDQIPLRKLWLAAGLGPLPR